ncbi:MAG: TrmB family transcriptional regulator [Candidatus Heimdallarchaeota archaeon]
MVLNLEKTAKNEYISGLKMLGLSTYEASTFYTLITRSELTAADLCSLTGIPDSKIYHTLNTLEQRGMIAVQKGRPNRFKALKPDEAMANLKHGLIEEHRRKLRMLEALTTKLLTLYESIEGREEVELAYIIRGIRGILYKMNNLIRQARRSLLIFVSDMEMWRGIEPSIVEAAGQGVKIYLGITKNIEQTPIFDRLGTVKWIDCLCGLLVVDDQTLLDITEWRPNGAMAILTQEPNIIRFTWEYYKNPKCCSHVE